MYTLKVTQHIFTCTITHSRVNHELLYLTRNIGRSLSGRTISRTRSIGCKDHEHIYNLKASDVNSARRRMSPREKKTYLIVGRDLHE
jgi:hypothetical protein